MDVEDRNCAVGLPLPHTMGTTGMSPPFANSLADAKFKVKRWIGETKKITKLYSAHTSSPTILEEVKFWLKLEKTILETQDETPSASFECILILLFQNRPEIAELKAVLATAKTYNHLLKNFPINDLLSASEMSGIVSALRAIFRYLRNVEDTKFLIESARCSRLLEAVSRDLTKQLLMILGSSRQLLSLPYENFYKGLLICLDVLNFWDINSYNLNQFALRDNSEKEGAAYFKTILRVDFAHELLRDSLYRLRKYQHEKFRSAVALALRPTSSQGAVPPIGDKSAEHETYVKVIEEVNLAYEVVKGEVDGLDISEDGLTAWKAGIENYEERIDRIEAVILDQLRKRIEKTRNSNEMLRILSRFKALSFRPRIEKTIIEGRTALIEKVKLDNADVAARTTDFLNDWEKGKPVECHLRPDEAISCLNFFKETFSRLEKDRAEVQKVKEALEIQDPGTSNPSDDERFMVAFEKMHDLKGVWQKLAKIWEQIDEMKEKRWLSIQPRELRQQIDNLLNQLKYLPAYLMEYASYEFVKKLLQSYAEVNKLIVELKSDALKERHWKQLMRQWPVNWVLSDLSLGQVWGVDLQKNEPLIKDVIFLAQGEMAMEEFLNEVGEAWQTCKLDMFNYQDKCRLITGLDDLATKVKEHINSVAAMKPSPYCKVFEEEAITLEEMLNRINALFDVWIDVQGTWVYLEGIFTESADIKALLPVETSRFQSISIEFFDLMKEVAKSPRVMDVVNIPGVQRLLERLADLLGKIQKAHAEYIILERERSSFPRFYFVGDEDLLEIIGDSKNIPRLQKHFKKMFAGIDSVLLNEDNTLITGISSREGENVHFDNHVVVAQHPTSNGWLSRVESEMRLTLSRLLASAVADAREFRLASPIATLHDFYVMWIDKYPYQIVVLAAQICWTEDVENALQTIANVRENQDMKPLENVLQRVESTLNVLAPDLRVSQEQLTAVRRKKLENLITEFNHKRDVTRRLIEKRVANPKSPDWLCQMRFYLDPLQRADVSPRSVTIRVDNASFNYGFEYLGVEEKLVQTPAIDHRCHLTMAQALEAGLGCALFGPAGTGKTASVQALGHQLGRFVLVCNYGDQTFDFQAMKRLFLGLCLVGAWACFGEFHRLELTASYAVSRQIQIIQKGIVERGLKKAGEVAVELSRKQVKVNPETAIFIAMNPKLCKLPENLKTLFLCHAMTTY